jgi:hypothetical protein
MHRSRAAATLALICSFVGGCAVGTEKMSDVPAIIDGPTTASREELSQAVTRMLNMPVTLADDALTRESTLSIERTPIRDASGRRIEARERAAPELFRLVKRGAECVLIHERTKAESVLHSARCTPR